MECNSCNKEDCAAKKRGSEETDKEYEERQRLYSRLCRINNKILVLSGKGGVGKSTVAVNLAFSLRQAGYKVGLLDTDIHGPSIPTMLGLNGKRPSMDPDGIIPLDVHGVKVMSVGLFLRDEDEAVIWRGPLKMGVIKQFLMDVNWGDLDYLVIDSPPGTGDEPLSVSQLIGDITGAIIVTTPQRVSEVDVRKSITFCQRLNVPVLGVVENMGSFACPKCGEVTKLWGEGAGTKISRDMGVPFLGSIPID
ncbi:MAG: Mrp/NBP35 family ATP-binding protein, partial [Desulfatiglandales bacterium]